MKTMKKAVSLLLVVVLTAAFLSFAQAGEAFFNEESGITFTAPSGYTARDNSNGDSYALIINRDNGNLDYHYVIEYNDDYAERWLEDLDEEEIEALAQFYADEEGDLLYTVQEAGGDSYLLLQNEDRTFGGVLSLFNGWMCLLYYEVDEGFEATDEAWNDVAKLQGGVKYANEAGPAEADEDEEDEEDE